MVRGLKTERWSRFISQNSYISSHLLSITPFPGDPVPLSDLHRYQVCMWSDKYKQENSYTLKKNKKIKLRKYVLHLYFKHLFQFNPSWTRAASHLCTSSSSNQEHSENPTVLWTYWDWQLPGNKQCEHQLALGQAPQPSSLLPASGVRRKCHLLVRNLGS